MHDPVQHSGTGHLEWQSVPLIQSSEEDFYGCQISGQLITDICCHFFRLQDC